MPWNCIDKNIPVIFYGCGNNARIVKKLLIQKGIVPTAYCDSNQNLIGNIIEEVPVLSYEQVKKCYKEYYIILTVAINNALDIIHTLKEAKETQPIFHMEKPFKVDEELFEYEYLLKNLESFETIYDIMEDEISKMLLVESINSKLSGSKLNLVKYIDGDSFFDQTFIPVSKHYNYVDVGAYTGDTLLRFYAFVGGEYDSIHAIEPDKANFSALQDVIKYGRLDNVHLYNVGGWNRKDMLTFYTLDHNVEHFDSPNFFRHMKKPTDSSWGMDEKRYIEEKIIVDTIDNLLGDSPCDVIKINALAADFQTLEGCKKTLHRCKPIIVGEYGTRKENLTDMILFIKEQNLGYKFFLRQKKIFQDCKTIFYAVPNKF